MYNQLLLRKKLTSFLFEEREKSLPSPNRSIIPIDIPQDIVLSHAVRIHLISWSLTAQSYCLGCPGDGIIKDKETFEESDVECCVNYQYNAEDSQEFLDRCPIYLSFIFILEALQCVADHDD